MRMGEDMTNMRISRRNRDRLAMFGFAGESFDDALDRVLTMAEEVNKEKNRTRNPSMARVLEPVTA